MSIGYSIVIAAMPFFDLLDSEEQALATQVADTDDARKVVAVMDASRRRLAQGVDAFVRALPSAIRHDANMSRAAAYTVVGLADERMLHRPAGGLERWRERLLEFDLYGSALAGQEIVRSARMAAQGGGDSGQAWLAPLYLAAFREGFEGSLRGDLHAVTTLLASLEDTLGVDREHQIELAGGPGPRRIGVAPVPLMIAGFALWLLTGWSAWFAASVDQLRLAERIASRIESQTRITLDGNPLDRSVGPFHVPDTQARRSTLAEEEEADDRDLMLLRTDEVGTRE